MYSTLWQDKGTSEEAIVPDNSLALLASLLAYVANSEQGTEDVDQLLCRALHLVSPDKLSDWHLGPLLSGEWVWLNLRL